MNADASHLNNYANEAMWDRTLQVEGKAIPAIHR